MKYSLSSCFCAVVLCALAPQKRGGGTVCIKINTDKITHDTTSLFFTLIYYASHCANTHLLQSTWLFAQV